KRGRKKRSDVELCCVWDTLRYCWYILFFHRIYLYLCLYPSFDVIPNQPLSTRRPTNHHQSIETEQRTKQSREKQREREGENKAESELCSFCNGLEVR
ncbi:hypothetical protein ISN44_As09g018030, partial [Arabidopsis suecica]